MSIFGLAALIALCGLIVYATISSRRRLSALADDSSEVSREARAVLSRLDPSQLSSIQKEVSSGRLLNAIKQIREAVPGLGLREAKDAAELLKRDTL